MSVAALRFFRAGFFVLLVTAIAACGPAQYGASTSDENLSREDYPTVLTSPEALAGDFAMQQDVTMRHPMGEHSFSAVLQKQGEVITLVILGPHGGRAMTLTQRGGEVESELHVDADLPFPPEYILHDVHRTWFARVTQAATDGERIVETRENGRVMTRTFTRLAGEPDGAIVVRFEGGIDPGAPLTAAPPERVLVENGWFGYEAEIVTQGWTAL